MEAVTNEAATYTLTLSTTFWHLSQERNMTSSDGVNDNYESGWYRVERRGQTTTKVTMDEKRLRVLWSDLCDESDPTWIDDDERRKWVAKAANAVRSVRKQLDTMTNAPELAMPRWIAR